jgi:hypothetical protein
MKTAEKEAANKEAADKEMTSASVGGSCSKSAARTKGGTHGLLLSHSVDEADVAVADRRDEAVRILQYKHPPLQLQNLRAELSDDGDALVLFWACETFSRSCTPLPCAFLPSTRPNPSLKERSLEPARR